MSNIKYEFYELCGAIESWLNIKGKFGHTTKFNVIDASHSALLQRILNKQEIFDLPPPLSYSYPNYELMEKGECTPFEVYDNSDIVNGHITIDQSFWKILKQNGPNDWDVDYYYNAQRDQLTGNSFRVYIDTIDDSQPEGHWLRNKWKLIKVK